VLLGERDQFEVDRGDAAGIGVRGPRDRGGENGGGHGCGPTQQVTAVEVATRHAGNLGPFDERNLDGSGRRTKHR